MRDYIHSHLHHLEMWPPFFLTTSRSLEFTDFDIRRGMKIIVCILYIFLQFSKKTATRISKLAQNWHRFVWLPTLENLTVSNTVYFICIYLKTTIWILILKKT